MGLLLSCGACSKKETVNDKPIREFDLERYLGSWYEIARFDHYFEKDMDFTQAHYSLQDDGSVKVLNSGLKNGKYKESTGKAKRPAPASEPAMMKVSFFWPFFSDYRVLMVDEDYRYALVSSKGPDYLWILARDYYLPDEVLQLILSEAEIRGFDTSKLVWIEQDGM